MPKTDSPKNTVGCKTENNAKKVNPIQQWNQIDWKNAEKRVFKLQKRIYKASRRDDVLAVRRLQKTLIKSWTAKCLAVRRVTQENTGKKTAGVDGVKSLSPVARMKLVNKLKLSSKVSPTRRVWIDKPGKDEKRPLGIPTMYDRALQALVKMALEPEWEAKFEPNSYGFRPGRSCHDAIGAIFLAIKQKSKYVLDADIAKCFDRINHEALLKKLNTFPTIRRQVRAWLKAGVMDGKRLFPTSEGTPQGGVISPLLANIALHGMENAVKELADTFDMKRPDGTQLAKRDKQKSVNFVRYADDFVILHEDLTIVKRCQEFIANWLKGMGLELKPSKTRLAHTLEEHLEEKPGFDFLGFNVRQYPTGKNTSGRVKGKLLGFKTIITPSKDSQKKHYKKVAEIIEQHQGLSQTTLIKNLNPIIRGWCNYFSTVVSQKIFERIWHLTVWKLIKWGIKRHRNKGKKWVYLKYFQTIGGDNWTFATNPKGKNPMRLLKHSETKITRYVKVKEDASPYNGDTIYWSSRRGTHPEMLKRTASLLKKQNGKCLHCGLSFKNGDLIELDHIIPKSKGGRNEYNNYQLLHRHCHDEKTRTDGSLHRDLISQIKLPRNYKWVQDMLVTC
ncbi:group II intron reverse transcriptase/maturase [Capilliphycus salinus ALCB114379]|uniref:group II intron reverse transcriptase/maturase n=1 Tax=Capilliphycus salinus TaxID=2768948 RepID=UPI0039A4186E